MVNKIWVIIDMSVFRNSSLDLVKKANLNSTAYDL